MRIPATLLAIALAAPATALEVETRLNLIVGPGRNLLFLGIDPDDFDASSDVTRLTGGFNATLDVDPETGAVRGMTLAGGPIAGTDTNFSGGGSFGSNYDLSLTGFSGTLRTPAPPALVNPDNGSFNGEQFSVYADQGMVSGNVSTLLGNYPVSLPLSENPLDAAGTGTGTIALTPVSEDELTRSFDIALTFPVTVSRTIPVDSPLGTTNIAVTASGTIEAVGQVPVPRSEYIAWTIAQGSDGADPDADLNGDGVPNGIAWALGLAITDDARPFVPTPTPGGGFELTLPGPTAAPLSLQSSPHLAGWSLLDAARLPLPNPLPAGSEGSLTIAPAGIPGEFVRLLSPEQE